ncbi:biopolymer transporter ExbD [Ideonella sp. B508-1]|uniref:ExbD/TolR family protein n=1 Tax=Ideonella sp. B508-1 TaxID=137716 RepID=UPI0003463D08|nr:biopolymer transporter ExbD [Ideonella sp. B508-1]
MNFRGSSSDEPEINLIPFIDVLLVILIFLMLSTTYAKFTELQVNLPSASADPVKERPAQIVVAVAADGRYAVDGQAVDGRNVDTLAASLQKAASGQDNCFVIISADATAAHQSVINVLDAARRVGLNRITFAAQLPAQSTPGQP